MTRKNNVAVLPGDGVGPEVVSSAQRVLSAVVPDLVYSTHAFGGAAIDAEGEPLSEATLKACRDADAVLLGAIGGPKWDKAPVRPEAGLLALRKGLGLYANLRPIKAITGITEASSPLRAELVAGVDMIIVRELTGGIYFGQPRWRREVDGEEKAVDTAEYTTSTIKRITELAFNLAKKRRRLVTSIDKSNVLDTSRLWRDVVNEVHKGFSDVELNHQLVDSAAMRLITHAKTFDILLTNNMFGDILSDEASVLVGSIGLLPSASIGEGEIGLYEPIHGSAPDIAGQGIANPIGTILSAAMMLRLSLGRADAAERVESAVDKALAKGVRTRDLGGQHSTADMTEAVLSEIS